jgi:anti-anti-sigma factor
VKPVLGPLAIIERGPGRYSLTGEIDLATAPQLDHLEDVHGPLLLDLHGVTFMDSTGIAALVRLWKRCPRRDCTLQIEACSRQVERVLSIAGLYEIFTQEDEARVTGEVAVGADAAAATGA